MAEKKTNQHPDFLKPVEAMAILRVGRSAFYRAVEAGDIPVVRIGKLIRVPRAALDALARDEGSAATAA